MMIPIDTNCLRQALKNKRKVEKAMTYQEEEMKKICI